MLLYFFRNFDGTSAGSVGGGGEGGLYGSSIFSPPRRSIAPNETRPLVVSLIYGQLSDETTGQDRECDLGRSLSPVEWDKIYTHRIITIRNCLNGIKLPICSIKYMTPSSVPALQHRHRRKFPYVTGMSRILNSL